MSNNLILFPQTSLQGQVKKVCNNRTTWECISEVSLLCLKVYPSVLVIIFPSLAQLKIFSAKRVAHCFE